jgi:Holliday junction resolvase RusA-like endonuclease
MVSFDLPVYYTHSTKKKSITFLVSQNKFRNLHFYQKNNLKKHYHKIISDMNLKKITGKYSVEIVYYYKNTRSDLSNVCSLISKFALDALQENGVIEDDNLMLCIKETYIVGCKSINNPRATITLKKEN